LDSTTDTHDRCVLHGKWSAYRLLLDGLKNIMASIATVQKKITANEKQARIAEPVRMSGIVSLREIFRQLNTFYNIFFFSASNSD